MQLSSAPNGTGGTVTLKTLNRPSHTTSPDHCFFELMFVLTKLYTFAGNGR